MQGSKEPEVSGLISELDDSFICLEMEEPGVEGVGKVMKSYLIYNMKIHIGKV